MERKILTNFDLLDTEKGVLKNNYQILIEGNKITEVKKGQINSSKIEKINLGGRTLMPGLIDCHVHIHIGQFNDNKSVHESEMTARSSKILREMLLRGFTTVRDAGGADYGHKMAIEKEYFIGPRLFVSGKILSQTGGHGDHRGRADFCECAINSGGIEIIADGVDEVRKAVREQIRQGVDQIKIMAGGGVSSPADELNNLQYSKEELMAIVDEATRAGRYVMSHVYNNEGIKRASECGIRTIEHGNFIQEDSASIMYKNKSFLVPTLVTYRADAEHGVSFGWEEHNKRKNQQVLDAGLRSLDIAKRANVKIGYGSDLCWSPKYYQPEGLLIHNEVLSNAETIQNITIINAEILRMKNLLGVIKSGAYADLIIVDGDPLKELGLLCNDGESISGVISNGKFIKKEFKLSNNL